MSLPLSEPLRTSSPVIFTAAYDEPPSAMKTAAEAITFE